MWPHKQQQSKHNFNLTLPVRCKLLIRFKYSECVKYSDLSIQKNIKNNRKWGSK